MFLIFLRWSFSLSIYYCITAGETFSTENYELLGCYNLTDRGDNFTRFRNNTPKECYNECHHFDYFGVKNDKCFCLSDVAKQNLEKTDGSVCQTKCPGNEDEICGKKGGPGHISLFGTNGTDSKPEQVPTTSREVSDSSGKSTESMITEPVSVSNTTVLTVDRLPNTITINTTPSASTSSLSVNLNETSSVETAFRNIPTDEFPLLKSTSFPDIIPDIDEGLVAGMSVLVVGAFAICILIAFVRNCYRKRKHKTEETVYEEVEDAATSCSIEGSSNIKFLIGKARNINKTRIDQINEEWLSKKSLMKQDVKTDDDRESSQSGEVDKPFSKCSVKSAKRTIIEEEDSEYATAEPEEDLYSLAEGEHDNDLYDIASNPEKSNENSDSGSRISPRLSQRRLVGSLAIDNWDDEDPYTETPEDEYDVVNSPRSHKNVPSIGVTQNTHQDDDEEHQYELTDDIEYDSVRNPKTQAGAIHRSKSLQRLHAKSTDSENIYSESFEGEYDVLNKPRFRITVSSDNYDNVVLPWETNTKSEENENWKNERECRDFDALESGELAISNLYNDMESIEKDINDQIFNKDKGCFDSEIEKLNVDILQETENLGVDAIKDINLNTCTNKSSSGSLSNSNGCHTSEFDSTDLLETSTSSAHEYKSEHSIPPLIVDNKCFGYKIGNGNIPKHTFHDFDVNSNGDVYKVQYT